MYKSQDEAINAMKKSHPEQGTVFDNLFDAIDKAFGEDQSEQTECEKIKKSLRFRLYLAIERLFVFQKVKDFDKGMEHYQNGDKEKAFEIFEKSREKKDYCYFYNELNLQEFFSIFEEIKEIVEKNKDEFIDLIIQKESFYKKEERELFRKTKHLFSYKNPPEYVIALYKLNVFEEFQYSIDQKRLKTKEYNELFISVLDDIIALKKQA